MKKIKSKTKYFLSCIFAALSISSSFAITSALKYNNLTRLQTTLPIALGIGLIIGFIYYQLLKKSLPKLDNINCEELWNGVSWFNWATSILWIKILPVPEYYIEFGIGFVLSAGCARLAGTVYTVFGSVLSNRKRFANTFIILTVTIMLVISVVKSSLALSLGLVGALSIIRFRTAIKEPEELAFLFFTIAIGLGFGAGKIAITLISFWAICIGFIFFKKINTDIHDKDAYLISVSSLNKDLNFKIKDFMSNKNIPYELIRFESKGTRKQISILANIASPALIQELEEMLTIRDKETQITISQSRNLA